MLNNKVEEISTPSSKVNLNVLNSIQNAMKMSKKDISIKKYESNNILRPYTANFPENLNIRNKFISDIGMSGMKFNNKLLFEKGNSKKEVAGIINEKKSETNKFLNAKEPNLTIFDFKK
jgi:hypothetical protein